MVEEGRNEMSIKRWIVTYTKHMKQKRKVYQDGVLELCSSSGKSQVMLYDDCEKLIDRRFLKKDEVVISGGTLSFETHIVDIGDPDGKNMPSAESNMKSGIRPESQKEKLCVEWNVLYTSQMTQKAKRYHDGILRVLISSSQLYLITLLNEDGAILSSKYLKSVACVETGKNCDFPNFLVEICERRASAAGQDESSNVDSSCKDLRMKDSMNQFATSKPEKCDKLAASRKSCKIPMHSVPTKKVSGCKASSTRASATPCNLPMDHSRKVTNNCSPINSNTTTLRDALQILSVLKKPSPERSLVLGDALVEQGLTSQSSDKCQLDWQALSSEKTRSSAWHDLKSVDSQEASIPAAILVLDTDCNGCSSAKDRASSRWSSVVVRSTSPTKSSINNTADGHTSLTTNVSEVPRDLILPGSSETTKADKPISNIGLSKEVNDDMNPTVPLQKPLGALNGKQHLSASTSSLLKENLDADGSSLHGMDVGISSDSTPDKHCAKTTQAGESYESVSCACAASTVHATSDTTKDPEIPSSVELANEEGFPTFYLGF